MRINKGLCAVAVSAFAVLSVTSAQAAKMTLDISGLTNASAGNLTNGASYPLGGSTISIGGVNFTLATDMNNVAQIIQTGTGDPNFFPQSPGPYTIDVGVAGVQTVYAIINSAFGAANADVGSLTFQGANPADTLTFNLTEGVNIRDHYTNSGFNQDAPDVFATGLTTTRRVPA